MGSKLGRRDRQIRAALVYARTHTDFHVEEIRQVCKLLQREDHLPILQEVKDVAPFELWPVYERTGWWTSSPSQEVRAVALFRAAERNATEQQRNFQVLKRHQRGNPLTGEAKVAAKQATGVKELFEDDLPDPDRTNDHCLMRIDQLMALEVEV